MPNIDWSAVAQGGTFTLALLVEGLDRLIVPSGVTVNSVTTSDPAWHVANFTPGLVTVPWLAFGVDDLPDFVLDESMKPWSAEIDVAAVTVPLVDIDGDVTAFLGSREAMPQCRLMASLEPTDLTMTVEHTNTFAGLAPPFEVVVGREVIRVAAVAGGRLGTLTGLTRGLYGTAARRHIADGIRPNPTIYAVTAGGLTLPSLVGRRCTVWGLHFTAPGVAGQCNLLFDGTIGPGVATDGPAYLLPVDHSSKALAATPADRRVTLSGWAHPGGIASTPLCILDNITNQAIVLGDDPAIPRDNLGWHPGRSAFLAAMTSAINAAGLSATLSVGISTDDTLTVSRNAAGLCTSMADWSEAGPVYRISGSDTIARFSDMPQVCVWLDRQVWLTAWDMAAVPAVPADPLDAGTFTRAWWCLQVPAASGSEEDPPRRARITVRNAVAPYSCLTCVPVDLRREDVLITEPTGALLALHYESATWWDGLRYAVFPMLGAETSVDHAADHVNWTRIQQVASVNHGAFSAARRGFVDAGTSMLDLLRREAMSAGLCLSVHAGRIAVVRAHDIGATETCAATLTAADYIDQEIPVVEDVHDGLIAGYRATFPNGDVIETRDAAADAEGGKTEPIQIDVPRGAVPDGAARDGAVQQAVLDQAMAVTGPWRRSYRQTVVRTHVAYAGLQLGDSLFLSDFQTPNGIGSRGFTALPCLVLARRVDLGTGEVALTLRVGNALLAGYVPEVPVRQIVGTVVSVDQTTYGATGFAGDLMADGTARTDAGCSTLVVGDKVKFLEMDTTTPAAAALATITAVNATAMPPTIEVDPAPGAAWEARAATLGSVLLSFDAYANATRAAAGEPAQHAYAFVASDATLLLNGTDPAKRFAP